MSILFFSNEVLVTRLRKGDEKAFREIYTRYWKKLFSIASRKVEDHAIVEGIVQDIFLKLWERRESLKIENLEAYLVTAVRYTCINHIKLEMLHEKYELYTHYHYSGEISSTDEQMDLADLITVIENLLSSFPENSQLIFRLHRLECKSTKEISKQLDMPQRTVEAHLSKVVQAMKIYLHDYL